MNTLVEPILRRNVVYVCIYVCGLDIAWERYDITCYLYFFKRCVYT